MNFDKLPNYHQLRVKPGAPAGASWGIFGDRDELGCLNFLTPEGLVDAARLVQSGNIFRLYAKIGFAKPPCLAATPWRTEAASAKLHAGAEAGDEQV